MGRLRRRCERDVSARGQAGLLGAGPQGADELGAVVPSPRRIDLQRTPEHAGLRRRKIREIDVAVELRPHDRERIEFRVGKSTDAEFDVGHGQRILIGRRRRVIWRRHHLGGGVGEARHRVGRGPHLALCPGESEVADLDGVPDEQDVLRLHVAVNDARAQDGQEDRAPERHAMRRCNGSQRG